MIEEGEGEREIRKRKRVHRGMKTQRQRKIKK
jgi:hypothetical protein